MLTILIIYAILTILLLLNCHKSLAYAEKIKIFNSKKNVSLILPIKGTSEFLEKCIGSWLSQDIDGELEFIFSLQDRNDPALVFLNSLPEKFKAQIIINDVMNGFSGKGSNLHQGYAKAKNEIIIFIDSDILAEQGTLSKILSLIKDDKTLVSCLPLHINPQNIWACIYTYIWNIPLVCLWAPSMISNKSIGVAGGVVAFNRRLLEGIGGVQAFAGYLAEDLMFGELVKKANGSLVLGPKVFSPVEKQSFSKLKNNMRRAHLIGIHFSKASKPISILGMLIGYTYSILPFVFLLTFNFIFLQVWLGFVFIKALLLIFLRLQLEKKWKIDLSFLIGDFLNLIIYLTSLFDNQVIWGGEVHKIGFRGKIL